MINTTLFTNASDGVVGIMQAINNESSGAFGLLFLISYYMVIFFPTLRWGVKVAFSSAAFSGVVVAMLLRLMELINDIVMYAAIILVVLAVAILYMTRE